MFQLIFVVVAKLCPTLSIPWTIALQAPLSMGFLRQEYWSGLPFPLPGGLPDPKIKPTLLMSLALTGRFFTTSTTSEVHRTSWLLQILAIMKEASIKIHLQIFVFMFSTYLNEYQGLKLCLLHWQVIFTTKPSGKPLAHLTSSLSGPENSC